MVVYGINNISLQTFSAQNSTVLDDYNMTDSNNTTSLATLPTIWPEASSNTSTTQTTTTFHPRDIFNMLNPSDHAPEEEQEPKDVPTTEQEPKDVPTTEQEPKDVVISNKTVIIDGGNDSIIINDNF
jgi:S-adenosylmethionine hydrolase